MKREVQKRAASWYAYCYNWIIHIVCWWFVETFFRVIPSKMCALRIYRDRKRKRDRHTVSTRIQCSSSSSSSKPRKRKCQVSGNWIEYSFVVNYFLCVCVFPYCFPLLVLAFMQRAKCKNFIVHTAHIDCSTLLCCRCTHSSYLLMFWFFSRICLDG